MAVASTQSSTDALIKSNNELIKAQQAIANESNRVSLAMTYAQATMKAGDRLKT